jgi:hypothetical protein
VVLGPGDGTWLGDVLAEMFGDTLGRTLGDLLAEMSGALGGAVLGISLRCRRNEVLGISIGNFETLGYVIGSDDGITLGDVLAEMLGDTLSRTLGNDVLGCSLGCRRLGSSLGEKVGNDVLGVSLGNLEAINCEPLGYVLGSDEDTWSGARLAEMLVALGYALRGISLLCGRNELLGSSLGSDNGIWIGNLLAGGLGDTLGRTL